MSVLTILIGIGFLVALGFLGAFFWAVRSGQYEDTYTPSLRVLYDDSQPPRHLTQKDPYRDHRNP